MTSTPEHHADRRPEPRFAPAVSCAGLVLMLALAAMSLALRPIDMREPLMTKPAGFAIDLNQADAATLGLLPLIGPGLAERIVEHREAHGPFKTAHDLARIRGIGPITIERVTDLVVVTPGQPPK